MRSSRRQCPGRTGTRRRRRAAPRGVLGTGLGARASHRRIERRPIARERGNRRIKPAHGSPGGLDQPGIGAGTGASRHQPLQRLGARHLPQRRAIVDRSKRPRHAARHRLVEFEPLPQIAHARAIEADRREQRPEGLAQATGRREDALDRGGSHWPDYIQPPGRIPCAIPLGCGQGSRRRRRPSAPARPRRAAAPGAGTGLKSYSITNE